LADAPSLLLTTHQFIFLYRNIQKLTRSIDEEYLRLAQAQRRPVVHSKESRLSKLLGIKYLTGSDTGRLHSSTAFVEFRTLAAKQHAVQCNLTGMNKYLVVTPVPEVRDLLWDNMHVSRSLIETRAAWANVALTGGLFVWSIVVFSIRSVSNIGVLASPITESQAVVDFLNFYAPALIVEGLVRVIPKLLHALCLWIRFKSHSEKDHYILRWYFGYRLLTFVFLLIGGTTLVDSSDSLIRDPLQFIKNLSGNVAASAQFFMSYVLIQGGGQVFFRLSQFHNLVMYWLMQKVYKEESQSQRRLETMRRSIKVSGFLVFPFVPACFALFRHLTKYSRYRRSTWMNLFRCLYLCS
jgi:hypothetical protein